MATITVKNIPDDRYERLKDLAAEPGISFVTADPQSVRMSPDLALSLDGFLAP